jgi:rhodanese-related sulfurtransferase
VILECRADTNFSNPLNWIPREIYSRQLDADRCGFEQRFLFAAARGARCRCHRYFANEAVQCMNREKGVVIDVCSAEEFAASHINGAVNVPLDQLEARLAIVVKNKSLPLILVCATGPRSKRAQAMAQKLGYEKVHSLQGGLKAWKEANLPVTKI